MCAGVLSARARARARPGPQSWGPLGPSLKDNLDETFSRARQFFFLPACFFFFLFSSKLFACIFSHRTHWKVRKIASTNNLARIGAFHVIVKKTPHTTEKGASTLLKPRKICKIKGGGNICCLLRDTSWPAKTKCAGFKKGKPIEYSSKTQNSPCWWQLC